MSDISSLRRHFACFGVLSRGRRGKRLVEAWEHPHTTTVLVATVLPFSPESSTPRAQPFESPSKPSRANLIAALSNLPPAVRFFSVHFCNGLAIATILGTA